jgi:hypothetical protein
MSLFSTSDYLQANRYEARTRLARVRDSRLANTMTLTKFNPLADPRWDRFVETHPRASIFHTTGWLEALRRTYDYQPIAYTTSSPSAKLQNSVVFCQVESSLTGPRLVSLPFSEYCDPLVDSVAELQAIMAELAETEMCNGMWRYIEVRPTRTCEAGTGMFHSRHDYVIHRLDLGPSLSQVFGTFHKSSTQRKIRRAKREALQYEYGRSEALLSTFYRLHIRTRRRHGVPPQPLSWFRNLISCLGDALQIRVARCGSRAIAATVTLRYKDTLLYKYGCSDERFHNLGGMHLLLWNSIREAKQAGLATFDFGRSDNNNEGLIRFKDRWGTKRATLTYSRYTASSHSVDNYKPSRNQWGLRIAKRILTHAPGKFLSMIGQALYKHIG